MKTIPRMRLAIISDIHYASDAEKARRGTYLNPIGNRLQRGLVRFYRYFIWDRHGYGRNHLLDCFLDDVGPVDFLVANGDYSCDMLNVGMIDDGAFESASISLGKLRARFDGRMAATFGDHEIGKKMLAAEAGGLRLASYRRAQDELQLRPFWTVRFGRYVLMGVVSTVVALPVLEAEAVEEEKPEWRRAREEHLAQIAEAFDALAPEDRVLLFCHDPTALPFLGREEAVRRKLGQIERTIIGHLHSPFVLKQVRLMSKLPSLAFLGHSARRMSLAVRESRAWEPFKVLLCPSPMGLRLLTDGGYYWVDLDLEGREAARFVFRPLRRTKPGAD